MHYGSQTPKRSKGYSNNRFIGRLNAGRLQRSKARSVIKTSKVYYDRQGRKRFCGTRLLKQTERGSQKLRLISMPTQLQLFCFRIWGMCTCKSTIMFFVLMTSMPIQATNCELKAAPNVPLLQIIESLHDAHFPLSSTLSPRLRPGTIPQPSGGKSSG